VLIEVLQGLQVGLPELTMRGREEQWSSSLGLAEGDVGWLIYFDVDVDTESFDLVALRLRAHPHVIYQT